MACRRAALSRHAASQPTRPAPARAEQAGMMAVAHSWWWAMGGHHLLHRAAASPRLEPLSPTIATRTSPGELVAAPASMWLIDLEGNDAVPARWLGANPPGVPTEGRSPFLATRHVRSPHGESPHSSPGKAH